MLPLDRTKYRLEDAIVEASKTFRQGHILKDVPIGFAVAGGQAMTVEGRQALVTSAGVDSIAQSRAPYAMLVSQTCDIQNERRMELVPLLNVVPVYNAFAYFRDAQTRALLRKERPYPYLVRVDSPLASLANDPDHQWVADLNYDFPIDRAVLVDRAPIEAFRTEEGYVAAARRIGAHRWRPGINDDVWNRVLKPLARMLKQKKLSRKVAEIWLGCDDGFLAPSGVRIYVTAESDADVALLYEAIDMWYSEELQEQLRDQPAPFAVRMPRVMLENDLTRDLQKRAVPIDLFEEDWTALPSEAASIASAVVDEA